MKAEPRLPDESVNVTRTNLLREAALLAATVAVVAVAVFVVAAFFVELAAPLVPVEAERRLFQVWALEAGTEWGESVPSDRLIQRLAGHWDDNPYAFEVRVIPEPAINAIALPGGVVLLTEGLLEQVESENELAFVLAHEIGHYRNRDHLEALGRGVVLRLLLAAIGVGGSDIAGPLVGTVGALTDRGFGREQERDADAFGLHLLYEEYGHVAGSTAFFDRLSHEESTLDELAANFTGTHPGSAQRVEELEELAEERGWPKSGTLLPVSPP